MTLLLNWREAQRDDRPLLQGFSCTVPRPRHPLTRELLPHPRPWERKVEAGLRNLKPPTGDRCLLLGLDADEQLVAVALVEACEGGRVAKLSAVAVALDHQRTGLRYADEALEMALRAAGDAGHGSGHPVVSVYGLVDPRNHASQKMNTRAGLVHLFDEDDGHQRWVIELEMPPELLSS